MKRRRRMAAWMLLPIALAIGAWFVLWGRRAGIFWRMDAEAALGAGLAAALLCLAAVFIKPIPIKASAIFAMYLFLFGLLAEAVLSVLGLLAPFFLRLRNAGVFPPALAVFAVGYAAVHGRKTVLTRYRIASPFVRAPLRIALLSDVHIGMSVDEKRLRETVERLVEARPDLLILAGDLVDEQTSASDMEAACRILGSMRPAYGAWFVYGNHDMAAAGPKLAFSAARYREALHENGIHILDDRAVELGGIATLAGRLDAWGSEAAPRLALSELLAHSDPALPVILVDHQPARVQEAVKAGVLLQLSGHTHGGQIWPAGAIFAWLRPNSFVYGHSIVGGTHVIVSSGLGTRGSRLRSGCTAEAVLIELMPAHADAQHF